MLDFFLLLFFNPVVPKVKTNVFAGLPAKIPSIHQPQQLHPPFPISNRTAMLVSGIQFQAKLECLQTGQFTGAAG